MKKAILTFGVLSGLAAALMMIATVPFLHSLDGAKGYVLGYTTIVLSMLLVYFGIRSYRDQAAGGNLTFGRGFLIGLAITLVSCCFYVLTWEIIYFNFIPHSMDSYFAKMIDHARASGASPEVIQAKVAAIERSEAQYRNPFYNAMYTFIEPFPVGLVITLVSAAILRRRSSASSAAAAS